MFMYVHEGYICVGVCGDQTLTLGVFSILLTRVVGTWHVC